MTGDGSQRPRLTLAEREKRRAEMRAMYFDDGLTMAQIAERFDLTRARVSVIINTPPAPYGRPPENEDDPGTTPGSSGP